MLKSCPRCTRQCNVEARICTCGYWYVENLEQITPDIRHVKRARLKKIIIKFSVLTSFIILVIATVAVLGGFTDFLQSKERDGKEYSELFDSSGNSQKTLSSNRFPKGRVEGKVLAVNSGDLITLVDEGNREFKIKLAGINAPAPEQEFGQQSKEYLESMVLNQKISVNLQKIEDSGILVGKVMLEDKNISLEQIKAGLAVVDEDALDQQMDYDRYIYIGAEKAARTAGTGLWVNSKTNITEDSPENAKKMLTENSASENVPADNPVVKSIETTNIKPDPSAPQNEVETTSDFGSISPLPTPSVTSEQSKIKTTPAARENAETKSSNQTVSATARCSDGTLSYSASRSGACSNHGGVSAWLGGSNPVPTVKTSEKTYIRGSRGGCYFLNSNGKKTYVDQSLCN